ncbi:hypothetical protein [Paraburkholderia piptadeniae]|nr:hypothetical protein [Paraburkholderia piptadeniae]
MRGQGSASRNPHRVYSGMRRGEILPAKVTRNGYSLDDSKNGRPRIIPIHPRIAVLARRVRFTIPV